MIHGDCLIAMSYYGRFLYVEAGSSRRPPPKKRLRSTAPYPSANLVRKSSPNKSFNAR
jgi:hypothetical protein